MIDYPIPCPRCGNKQVISKTWTETLTTYAGTNDVKFQQIICTNKDCQEAFDKNLQEDNKKKAQIREQREKNEEKRKAAFAARGK